MIETILAFSFSFLSFLIVYGVLNKLKLFEKSVNIVISSTIFFFVLYAFYFYHPFIESFFSFLSLLLFMIFILLSLYFYKTREKTA
jgi:hypothetical protein